MKIWSHPPLRLSKEDPKQLELTVLLKAIQKVFSKHTTPKDLIKVHSVRRKAEIINNFLSNCNYSYLFKCAKLMWIKCCWTFCHCDRLSGNGISHIEVLNIKHITSIRSVNGVGYIVYLDYSG